MKIPEVKISDTKFGRTFTWEDEHGINTWYNDHYMKIYRNAGEQKRKDCRVFGKDNGRIPNHELEGKKIHFLDRDEKEAYVESVHMHWDKGYYLMLLYYTLTERGERSHGTLFYENVNCNCPFILEYIEETKNRIKIEQ